MDRRFEEAWKRLDERRLRGTPFDQVLRTASDTELIAALATVGSNREPVAANAMATHLLNRMHRKPFLGSFLASLTILVLIYVLDYIYTGTFLLLDTGPRAIILAATTGAIAVLSFVSWQMWRGRLSRLRHAIRPRRDY